MAFPQDPNDVDIELYYDSTWNSIKSYVFHRDASPITITRGRSGEGKRADPGMLECQINNRDGRFTPKNPNSPLFGKIGRFTQIRVKVTYNAVTYVRFVGEVVSWPSRWDVSGRDVWIPLKAAGLLRRLGQAKKPLRAPLELTVLADSPSQFWRVDDGEDSVVARSSLPNGITHMNTLGTVGWRTVTAPPGGSELAPRLNDGFLSANFSQAPPWTIEWSAFRPDDGTLDSSVIFYFDYELNGATQQVQTTVLADSAVTPRDWYHYLVTGEQVGGNYELRWWKNGIAQGLVPTHSGAGTLGPLTYASTAGGFLGDTVSDFSVGYVAVYSGVAVDASEHSDALQAYNGDEAAVRFARICDQTAVDYEVVGDTSGLMGPQRYVTRLQALRDCEDLDQGFLHETRDVLGLRFRTNSSHYNQTPTLISYETKGLAHPLDPEPDDANVANDREVKRRLGGTARKELTSGPLSVEDPPDGVGRIDDSITVEAYGDDQLDHIAGWRLHVGTWDAERYPQVRMDLAANPALIPTIAAVDCGTALTITDLPTGWLWPGEAELLVEGYSEVIAFYDWDVVFNCSVGGPYQVIGRWGLLAHKLHAAINSSTTSIDIATTDATQPLLATTNLGSGYGVTIGGEELQITAVADSLITYGAAGTTSHGNNASVTPGLPGSLAQGNLLLILAAIRNSGTGVPNAPSGYTRLAVFPSAANVQIFAKIAGASESGPTVTFTGGVANADTSARMIRLAGKWHDVNNILVGSATRLNPSAQNIIYPGLPKPLCDNAIVIVAGWKQDDWTSVAQLSGMTEITEDSTTTGDDQGIVWDRVIQTTAASVPSGSFSVTGGASAISRSAIFALRCDYQTATATRSTNGITASHSAGDDVTMTKPMRWALT